MMPAALERPVGNQFSIEYYTDPLCCWSWALEPVWRQIERHHPGSLSWTVILGGMIESWSSFSDPINDVASPPQLAPLWQLAGRMTSVPIDPLIWHVDPPASSYPASVAVKAAGLQGTEAAIQYLRLAREAVMTRRLNIARRDVLLRLGDELAIATGRSFDVDRFEHDLERDEAIEAFRSDLERTRFRRIGRFPTIVVHGAIGSRIAVGYRSVDALERMLAAVSQPE
jgi:putative protein-disulfide isomerase